MALCPRCGEENPDRFKHCGFCGSALAAAAPARRKVATVLFCDMTGSTALGERLDPESVRDLMFRYFHDMRSAIERHGGTVEKYIGDAVMAVFGVPTTHEDDALRAVRAAAEMQASLAPLNEEFERRFGSSIALRIGVNTGEVVAGDPSAAETIVTGDVVNVAARLEQAAAPGEVLLGERTYRSTRRALSVEPVDPLDLKGKSEPVPAYRLVSIEEGPSAKAEALDVGMIGRERELAELQAAFAACREERRCRLVSVIGDAGVGKSRLIAEFLDSVDREATVLVGRCRSYGEGITYWPLAEIVQQATGGREEETADRARARISELLSGEPTSERVTELICTAVGLGDCAGSSEQIAWATRRLLETLARSRPVVLVFDDLHWAEPVFIDLVETLATRCRDAPILLLCPARPELLERHARFGASQADYYRPITLEPLGASDSARLVEALLGRASLPAETHARVTEFAGGNPLFIEELMGTLIDDGLIRRENGGWVTTGDLSQIAIPPTLEALLGSRLDRLDGEQRVTIERASVEGQTFHQDAVRALSPTDGRVEVPATLTALSNKQFIHSAAASVAGGVAFRFRHILIRDAAYRGVAKRTRAELHEQFAGWLENTAGGRIAEYEEVIGFHLEQAYRYRAELGPIDESARARAKRAAEHLGQAGRRALLTRGDVPAAVTLLERACSLVPEEDPHRRRLRIDLGAALVQAGELQRAGQVFTETIEGSAASGDRRVELEARVEGASLELLRKPEGRVAECVRLAEEAIPVFEEAEDDLALAKAWGLLAYAHGMIAGRWSAAAEALQRGLPHAQRAGSGYSESSILFLLGICALLGPMPAPDAIQLFEGLLQGGAQDPQREAGLLVVLARLKATVGRIDEAREIVARGRAMFEDLGQVTAARGSAMLACDVELPAEDYAAAERYLRPAFAALEQTGNRSYLAPVAGLPARSLYAQGRYEEVDPFLQACDEAAAGELVTARVLWGATSGKLLARRGERDEAEARAREAVERAEQADSPELRGDALLDLAEVLRLVDAPSESTSSALERAREAYEQKGHVPGAEKARRLLAELHADAPGGPQD